MPKELRIIAETKELNTLLGKRLFDKMNEKGIATVYAVILIVIIGAIAGAGGWLLGGTEVTEENALPGAGIRIDFVVCGSPTHPSHACFRQGAVEAAEPLGINVVFHWTEGAVPPMADAINVAVAAETDGIAVMAVGPETIKGPIESAMAQGIPVTLYMCDLPGIERTNWIGLGPGAMEHLGWMTAEGTDYDVPDGGRVLFATCGPGQSWSAPKRTGMTDYWENVGKTVTIDVLDIGFEISEAQSRVTAAIVADLDKYDAVYGAGNLGTMAAALALESITELEPGEIPFTGISVAEPIVKGIKEGYSPGVTDWQPYQSAYWAVKTLYLKIKWGFEPPNIDVPALWVDNTNVDLISSGTATHHY